MAIQALTAFSRKKASREQLLRALCEYEKWFVPIEVATSTMSTNTFECLSVWGAQSKVPKDQLYLFTDVEAGQKAAKSTVLGPYASPISGAVLFKNVPDGFREVHVNPGSDPEKSWFMGGDWLELARRWGAAVSLERLLGGKAKGELMNALIDYEAFITFKTPKGTLATAPGTGGLKNPAMVFTAADCADAALKEAGAAGKKWKRVPGTGRQLFTAFPKLEVDGLVFNPQGPGPTKVFDEPLCWGVITAIAARDQAAS